MTADIRITPALLAQATGCTLARAELFALPLEASCWLFNIDTPRRLARYLAQVGHESGSLRYTTELWGPTPAQSRYEGRKDLGNTQPGDGSLYRGRGLIQVTGRANYAQVTRTLAPLGAPDFEAEPLRLAEPRWSALSAAAWWANNGCNELADGDDFRALTRRINGGFNGMDDRVARLARAEAALA